MIYDFPMDNIIGSIFAENTVGITVSTKLVSESLSEMEDFVTENLRIPAIEEDEKDNYIPYYRKVNKGSGLTVLCEVGVDSDSFALVREKIDFFKGQHPYYRRISTWDQYSIVMATFIMDLFIKHKVTDNFLAGLLEMKYSGITDEFKPPFNYIVAWTEWLYMARVQPVGAMANNVKMIAHTRDIFIEVPHEIDQIRAFWECFREIHTFLNAWESANKK